MTEPGVVEFYFSYRSPYAWLASRRLPSVLAGLPVRVEYCPVWEPEPELVERLASAGLVWSFPQPSRDKRRYIFQDVRRYVRAYGYRFAWPIDRSPRWSPPHLGFLYARRAKRGLAYHQRIFDLRFEEGRDITEPDAVCEVIGELGLDPAAFSGALCRGGFDAEVVDCYRRADRAGVVGWPFFKYGLERFWGNDRLEWLVDSVKSGSTERDPTAAPVARAGAAS